MTFKYHCSLGIRICIPIPACGDTPRLQVSQEGVHKAPSNSLVDWVFVSGPGLLGVPIGLSAVSSHGACTAVFSAVAVIVGFTLSSVHTSSVHTLGRITWLACFLTVAGTYGSKCGIIDKSLADQLRSLALTTPTPPEVQVNRSKMGVPSENNFLVN